MIITKETNRTLVELFFSRKWHIDDNGLIFHNNIATMKVVARESPIFQQCLSEHNRRLWVSMEEEVKEGYGKEEEKAD